MNQIERLRALYITAHPARAPRGNTLAPLERDARALIAEHTALVSRYGDVAHAATKLDTRVLFRHLRPDLQPDVAALVRAARVIADAGTDIGLRLALRDIDLDATPGAFERAIQALREEVRRYTATVDALKRAAAEVERCVTALDVADLKSEEVIVPEPVPGAIVGA